MHTERAIFIYLGKHPLPHVTTIKEKVGCIWEGLEEEKGKWGKDVIIIIFREKKDLLWKVLVRNQRDNVKKRSVQI